MTVIPHLIWLLSLFQTGEAPTIDQDSLFAIITHKAGIAKGLAHNHFVYASKFEGQLSYNLENPLETQLEITFPVEDLVIDSPEKSKAWQGILQDMAVLDEPFSSQSDGNRKKIRKSMMSKDQLNSKVHKQIHARITGIRKEPSTFGKRSFDWILEVEVTIVGKKVAAQFPANLGEEDGGFTLESLGSLSFTQFGIEPYSAMLGAISNQDIFHVYVNLKAR